MGRRVAIVGGGISGLALAERLTEAGVEPLVLEADAEAGGKVRTIPRDGFLLEAGPNGFLDKEPATLDLADRLGLANELRRAERTAERRWVLLEGQLRQVPSTPPAFLRSDLLPAAAKARILGEVLSRRAPPDVDETIASFGRRHLGRRATRDLLASMVVGIYGGDAERLSLRSCFPRMAELERDHRSLILASLKLRKKGVAPGGVLTSCEGGLGAYVGRLAGQLGTIVRTGHPVEAVRPHGDGFRLAVGGAGADVIDVGAVALAIPAHDAAHLLEPLDPAAAALAKAVPYAPMAVVHLAWSKEAVAHPLDGFGFLVPPHEGRRILGAIFISSIYPWRAPPGQALCTVMIGGALRPDLAALPEAELVAIAREDLGRVIGATAEPSLAQVVRWERAIPQYVVGHDARLKALEERLAAIPGLYLAGNAWRGIGFNECVAGARPLADRIVRGLPG